MTILFSINHYNSNTSNSGTRKERKARRIHVRRMEAEALVARLRVQRVQAASDKVVQELERRANMLRERHRGITKKIEAIESNLDEIRGLQSSRASREYLDTYLSCKDDTTIPTQIFEECATTDRDRIPRLERMLYLIESCISRHASLSTSPSLISDCKTIAVRIEEMLSMAQTQPKGRAYLWDYLDTFRNIDEMDTASAFRCIMMWRDQYRVLSTTDSSSF